VLAFDAGTRDVIGETEAAIQKAPTIADVVQNMISHYDTSYSLYMKQTHNEWGLFRSMWIASVLLDRRLDRQDDDTRSWFMVFAILVAASALTSAMSIYALFCGASSTAWNSLASVFASALKGGISSVDPGSLLAHLVLIVHALLIVVFIHHALRNMFKHTWEKHVHSIEKVEKELSKEVSAAAASFASSSAVGQGKSSLSQTNDMLLKPPCPLRSQSDSQTGIQDTSAAPSAAMQKSPEGSISISSFRSSVSLLREKAASLVASERQQDLYFQG